MNYLEASELEAYGLESETAASWVSAASALMDAHCRRRSLGVAEYVERLRLPEGCNRVRLSYLPLAAAADATSPIVSMRGRYGCVRRGESSADLASDFARVFGIPGTWTELDAAAVDVSGETGELTVASHPLGLQYNEVEITYTAGMDPIPEAVKVACAQIVRNAQAMPALNVRGKGLDRMHMEYFSDSLLDSNVRSLLAPYVAQKVG